MGKLLDLVGFRAVNIELKKYIDVIEHKVDLNSEALLIHTHTVSQITDFPVALKNPYSLILKLNGGATEGTNMCTYDGGSAKTLNITASSIGAAPVSHNHSYLPLSGGNLSGNVTFTGDNQLSWSRNTDYLKIGFKNDADSDTDSYGYIRTGDNGNEYFRIESVNGSTSTTIASFKREGIRLGIGTFIGSLTGNATSASKASLLSNLYSSRPESANIEITGNGSLSTFKATSAMSVGKPPSDSHILHFEWDNAGGYNAQIAIATGSGGNLYTRGMSAGTWGTWKTLLHSANYSSYTVTKTGSGASGTWGISITGNAATATKATQDGSGNVITSKYVAIDTAQTINGVKTFSTEQRFSSSNSFRLSYGNYGIIFRNDGSNFYMLLTNSGEAASGNYNSLRPLRINLSTGEVDMSNGLISSGISKFTNTTEATSTTTGAVIISGGLSVAKQLVTNGKLFIGHANASNATIYLNNKKAIDGKDTWLRINDDTAFTAGVYFGSGRIRTDGNLQVGDGGSSVNITTSVIQFKKPTTISSTATITGVTSVTNTTASTSKTTGALKVSGGVGVAGKVNAASLGVNDTWTIQLGTTGSIDFILN